MCVLPDPACPYRSVSTGCARADGLVVYLLSRSLSDGILSVTKGDAAFATWREVADWTDSICRGLKGLGKTSVVVLHDREHKTDSGSLIKRLRLGGSSKDTFAGIPDAVAYLTRKVYIVDGEEREVTIAEFGSQEGKVTKNRFGFPPSLIDPSFPKMWEHINNRQNENN